MGLHELIFILLLNNISKKNIDKIIFFKSNYIVMLQMAQKRGNFELTKDAPMWYMNKSLTTVNI